MDADADHPDDALDSEADPDTAGDGAGDPREEPQPDAPADPGQEEHAQACTDGSECEGAVCAQGYCCDRPCNGICEICNSSGSEGRCVETDGILCSDADACTIDDRCSEGACAGNIMYCEGRPCENCGGETWHEDMGDWCADMGGAPMCFCLCS